MVEQVQILSRVLHEHSSCNRVVGLRRAFNEDERTLKLILLSALGLVARVPSHRPFAPQAVCAKGQSEDF